MVPCVLVGFAVGVSTQLVKDGGKDLDLGNPPDDPCWGVTGTKVEDLAAGYQVV